MPDKSVILKALKEDSLELIQKLNTGFLSIEKDPLKKEVLEDVMRSLHNLKGLSRVMGFDNVGALSHRMEDIVKMISDRKISFSPSMMNTFLQAVDGIDLYLKAVVENRETDFNAAKIMDQLDAMAKGEPLEVETAEKTKAPQAKLSDTAVIIPSGIQDSVRIRTDRLDYLLNLSSEMIIDRICLNKELKDMENIQDMVYKENQEWQNFSKKFQKLFLKTDDTRVRDLGDHLDKNIRNISVLNDHIINFYNDHSRTIQHHNIIVADYQQKIMEVRMLPLSILFSTFPRLVHDLANQFGKQIDFSIEGGEIEIDKKILENIRDPLIHLLRNAVDHGIEGPAQRAEKGKPAVGKIKISISYQGSHLKIEFSDDGHGIDIEEIKKSAVKKGFYREKEIELMEREDLLNLIFRPGFSTSEIITSVSGRGVGMDVVQKNIKGLNGFLHVETEKNAGTKIILLIPLSLATTNILIFEIESQLFAIPSLSVEETLEITMKDIHTVEGREAISIRDHILPLAWLDTVLGINRKKKKLKKLDPLSAVVVGREDKRVVFVADRLVDECEVVIKSVGEKFQDIFNIIGVTILGSGELVFILDPFELIISARKKETQSLTGEEGKKIFTKGHNILVTDDQMTIRQLQRSILESAGYHVEEARDGIEALEKISKLQIDLVVTDIEMPRMTGLELTENIKSKDSMKNIPVIIVSGLGSEEDKKRGIKLGADAYLTKTDFNQQNLIEIVKILLGRQK
ncbi:MAG: hybrid sensor histidine kinase/response regulator [bacterium]|nr:hybrid sensor histidine kinase/response regulator [bacterium]